MRFLLEAIALNSWAKTRKPLESLMSANGLRPRQRKQALKQVGVTQPYSQAPLCNSSVWAQSLLWHKPLCDLG